MESLLIILPGVLLDAASALPLSIGLLAAAHHKQNGSRALYLRNLNGSIAAGAVSLFLLWGSLFGDDLSSSSTAALIFLFAPIYSAAAQVVVYGVSALVIRRSKSPEAISPVSRRAMLAPLGMLGVLVFGIFMTSVEGSDLAIAHRASNPDTLEKLFEDSRSDGTVSAGVSLFLAQNPNTPPGILSDLAKHHEPAVRVHVVQHPSTPKEVIAGMRNDCSSFVRGAVEQRLGPVEVPKSTDCTRGPAKI